MTIDLRRRHVYALVLDIEGTTTPITFVEEVLSSYAREHLRACLEARRDHPQMLVAVAELATEHAADRSGPVTPPEWHAGTMAESLASVAVYAEWLMDRDRKSPGLKRLQGLIWELGYEAGELRGQVFDDVPGALVRCRSLGTEVAIYSSGSELAQRRLFESVESGDLTPFVNAYFDTSVGAKTEPSSYGKIAAAMRQAPKEVLFISDVTPELAAAKAAGMQVALCVRPGNRAQPDADDYERITSFKELT